ncbi:MAG: hypothetical protein E7E80_05960 [Cutibacterium avidum]|nr:hypothetical protein [Cutibacterium avidum]MDU3283385.1 hypothetical protein [Cutibacterium avidum]MDU3749926.1 hypothetical protein [Cutibacterium avidum]
MIELTLHTATVAGAAHNTSYPHLARIRTAEDLAAAAGFDHVAATYRSGHRSSSNFVCSDCVVMDVDNDHTEQVADWINPEHLSDLLPGVAHMTATSRNHLKLKGDHGPRPRFHVYSPITTTRDPHVYAGLKLSRVKQLAGFRARESWGCRGRPDRGGRVRADSRTAPREVGWC